MKNIKKDSFQTPIFICEYMVSLIPKNHNMILEPTPGNGNLLKVLIDKIGFEYILAPLDYFDHDFINKNISCVIMNPPFSDKTLFGNIPKRWGDVKGMKIGYKFLEDAMEISNNVIALMPWFTISDSDVRMRKLIDFGLKSVTLLPRRTFDYTRIQTCILELEKGHNGITQFKYIN